jgi:hypothetical protein
MQRLQYIDALRGIAIAYMIINHVGNYLFKDLITYNVYLSIYLTVSVAAPLFLFLVGFSLVLSYRGEKFIKYFKRGISLIVLNFLINGFFYFNEPLYRGRILFLIGLSVIFAYPLLLLSKKIKINSLISAVVIFLILILSPLTYSVINLIKLEVVKEVFISEFVFFPWFLLVVLGMIFADFWLKNKDLKKPVVVKKIATIGLTLIGVWFIGSILTGRWLLFLFTYDYNLNGYWLPSLLTWFWVVGLIFLTFALFYYFSKNDKLLISNLIFNGLSVIGRYALYIYFLQFFIIRTILEKITLPAFISDFPGFYLLIISLLIIILLCYLVKSKTFASLLALSRQKVTVRIF